MLNDELRVQRELIKAREPLRFTASLTDQVGSSLLKSAMQTHWMEDAARAASLSLEDPKIHALDQLSKSLSADLSRVRDISRSLAASDRLRDALSDTDP
jgi:hypothetical protein